MTDDEWAFAEIEYKEATAKFRDACGEMGMDFQEDADNIIYMAVHNEI